jgi:hypothetical protein
MKKLVLSLAILSFLTQVSYAQTNTPNILPNSTSDFKKFRFGAYIAPSLSWMKPTTAKDGDQTQKSDGSKVGFIYGLMADYNFSSNYSIATGLQVNGTGGKISTELNPSTPPPAGTVLSSKYNYSLKYLEIPLALKLKTDPINKFVFFGQLGVTMGFNISKKATYSVQTTDSLYTADSKEKVTGKVGVITPVIFQMNIGIGAQYPLNNKLDAYIGLFFNNGFAPDVTDPTKFKDKPYSFDDGRTRLNNFALRVGLYF